MNAVNDWIRKAKNPYEKDKRRAIIAALCIVGATVCLFFPYGWIASIILVVIAAVKVKNFITDDT